MCVSHTSSQMKQTRALSEIVHTYISQKQTPSLRAHVTLSQLRGAHTAQI